MAKKKDKKVEDQITDAVTTLNPIGEITIRQEKYEHCEWCFQFDEDEPQVFAWTDDEINSDEDPQVTFTINNSKNAYISFTNSQTGKVFKLFSRELSEKGKELRQNAKEVISKLSNQ
jgi:hypothetical protein